MLLFQSIYSLEEISEKKMVDELYSEKLVPCSFDFGNKSLLKT